MAEDTAIAAGPTAPAPAPMLAVRGLGKSYGGRAVVADAALDLVAGQITCLLGPSGCGKSTLLRLIAGLEPADAGTVHAGGRLLTGPGVALPPEARRIGLVFQELALFPHLSAIDNVAFGLTSLPGPARRARALALLDRLGLAERAGAFPHALSGGEQQRVAIARALAPGPDALLLDEPFSGLDGARRAAVRDAVADALRRAETAVLVVTHDAEEAMLLGDRLCLMAGGRILQEGAPADCYHRPVSLAAARLLGPVSALPASVRGGVADTPLGPMAAPGVADGAGLLLLRPEAVRIGDGGDAPGAAAVIEVARFAGRHHAITARLAGARVELHHAGPPPAIGSAVTLTADLGRAVVVAEELERSWSG